MISCKPGIGSPCQLVSRSSIQFQPFETIQGDPALSRSHLGDITDYSTGDKFHTKNIGLGFTDCSCDVGCNCLVLYIFLLKGKIGPSSVVYSGIKGSSWRCQWQWALSVRSNVEQSKMSVPPKTSPCFLPGSTRCWWTPLIIILFSMQTELMADRLTNLHR